MLCFNCNACAGSNSVEVNAKESSNGSVNNTACDLLESHAIIAQKNVSAQIPLASSTTSSSLDVNSLEIGEITEQADEEHMTTSAVLYYCKSKILYPYLKLLAFMGLRPVSLEQPQSSKFAVFFTQFHSVQVAILMAVGYVLQYMSCFRRDRGFCYKLVPATVLEAEYELSYEQICYGSATFSYIGPCILHFIGYLYAVYVFRILDNEQLQNLMERVFILSSFPPQGTPITSPKKLLRTLWFFIILSLIWMVLSFTVINVMMAEGTILFRWIERSPLEMKIALKILLIIATTIHDMVQATIITSYCLQAQLLMAHLQFLRSRLLNRTMTPLDWMREVAEFKKLLKHLNEDLAPAICFFTIVNVSWALSGAAWLLNLDKIDTDKLPVVGISILNEILWILASVVPFIQAARLTTACSMAQQIGHELSIRPFPHQETPQEDISMVLMYASSMRMAAKLFRCPIEGRYLCLALAIIAIIALTMGMCHYLEG